MSMPVFEQRTLSIPNLAQASAVQFGTSGVRGRVLDLSDEVCFAYTSAFLQSISAREGSVALAIDLRPSSPAMAAACSAAIRAAGLVVDYCGALPTPALACYTQAKGIPGVMVTGSHLPFERNGIKFYSAEGEITKAHEALISRSVVAVPARLPPESLPQLRRDAYRGYIDRYLNFFPAGCLAGMKLGLYEHSSVARDLLRELLQTLGAEVIGLGRTDSFVAIDTEAVSEADSQQAQAWAREHRFAAIISTDGDADRPLIGDENGNWLRGDIAAILCAQYLGAEAVATTVSCNTAVDRCGSFGKIVKTKIGSPYVIEGMQELLRSGERRVVGFEPNGGFLLGSAIEKNGRVMAPLMTRDAALPIISLLCRARESGANLSELPRQLPARFTVSDRLPDFPTAKSRSLIATLLQSPEALDELLAGLCAKTAGIDQTDGLRVFLENGEIVHFRSSGNAPELRCYAETSSAARSQYLVQALLQRLAEKNGSADHSKK